MMAGAATKETSASLATAEIGNERYDEIVPSHGPLAQSSNVTSPEEPEQLAGNRSQERTLQQVPLVERQDTRVIEDEKYSPQIPAVKEQYTESLEDDFFSFSVKTASFPEKRKKKKKKVRVKQAKHMPSVESVDPNSPTQEEYSTPLSSAELLTTTQTHEVITLGDDHEEEPYNKKRKMSLPKFDEQAHRLQMKNKLNAQYADQDDNLFESDDEDLSAQLKSLYSRVSKITSTIDTTSSRDSSEPAAVRQYQVAITSHLPGSEGTALELTMKGHKTFDFVIAKTLNYLIGYNNVSDVMQYIYRANNVVLMRDNLELREFMKPDSLHLQTTADGRPTCLELSLYTKTQALTYREYREYEKTKKLQQIQREEEIDRIARQNVAVDEIDAQASDEDKDFEEIDREIANEQRAVTAEPEESEEEDVYFKIILKGSGKARIEVQVRPSTLISKVADYYREKANLPAGTTLRLVFDDENLAFGDKVGDTELEQDFTVDVYVTE